MGCSKTDMRENLDQGIERQTKILELIKIWYEAVTSIPPPLITDPAVLSYNSKIEYYYTSETQSSGIIGPMVSEILTAMVKPYPGAVIDIPAIVGALTTILTGTTKNDIDQGYGSAAMISYPGELFGQRGMFKPIITVVSFNFSSQEYKSSYDVACMGYWSYLLFVPSSGQKKRKHPIRGIPDVTRIPDEDFETIGEKWMTKKELDSFANGIDFNSIVQKP
uniref:Uncharacterized protein n=1 Tax=Cunninghamella elegans TaxID=4853 RepID=Q52NJ9_CUNEL|nr:unknown [Cunninghamella elegans]